MFGRRGGVPPAGDHQRPGRDRCEVVTQVHLSDRLAQRGVPRFARRHHGDERGHFVGMARRTAASATARPRHRPRRPLLQRAPLPPGRARPKVDRVVPRCTTTPDDRSVRVEGRPRAWRSLHRSRCRRGGSGTARAGPAHRSLHGPSRPSRTAQGHHGCHRAQEGRSGRSGTAAAARPADGPKFARCCRASPARRRRGLGRPRIGDVQSIHRDKWRLRARFCAIRSGWTWRRSTLACNQSTAEPVERSKAFNAGHSACHPPAARLELAAARRLQQRRHQPWHLHRSGAAQIAAMGLRLCSIDDEIPAPSACSESSPTSLWASITMSSALTVATATRPQAPAIAAVAVRWAWRAGWCNGSPSRSANRAAIRRCSPYDVPSPVGPPSPTDTGAVRRAAAASC